MMKGLLKFSLSTLFSIGMISLSPHAHTLELGKATIASALGEPLSIHIPLDDASALTLDDIAVQLPKKALYDSFGLAYDAVHKALDYALHVDYNDDVWLVIESDEAVTSPYFVYIVQLTWPTGQLIKEQVALIDETPEITVSYRPQQKAAPAVVSDITLADEALADVTLADVPEAAPVPKGLQTRDIAVAGVPINPLANRTVGINKPPIDAQRLEEDAQAAVSDNIAAKKPHVDVLITQTQGVIHNAPETLVVATTPDKQAIGTRVLERAPVVTIETMADPLEIEVPVTSSLIIADTQSALLTTSEAQSVAALPVTSVAGDSDTVIELGKYSLFSRAGEPLDLFLPIKSSVPLGAEDFAVDVNVVGNTIEADSNITIQNPNQAMIELFTQDAIAQYRGENIVLALSFVIAGQEVKKNIVIAIK